MRMSCNGCRVLRKGCSDNCSIRPCLAWIKSPDAQANATVFLAKFYGRAGLMNLINAGPENLRPAIFRSLLYEACGRIVNPIYGSVGLLWSGSWQVCQSAVEAVLNGVSIKPIESNAAIDGHAPPLKPYDIRHVPKDESLSAWDRAGKLRCRAKRTGKAKLERNPEGDDGPNGSGSHESSLSHQSEIAGESKETESIVSVETGEPVLFRSDCVGSVGAEEGRREELVVGLELTLGLEPAAAAGRANHVVPVKKRRLEGYGRRWGEEETCKIELGLECGA